MKASELIEKLQDIIEASDDYDVDVRLEEVSGDRYGSTIGLIVGKNEVVLSQYFGAKMPLWCR